MDIVTPFVVPVAVVDVSKHLPLLRELFTGSKNKIVPSGPGFGTTLANYMFGATSNCLPQSEKGLELRRDVEKAAVDLATFMGYETDICQPEVKNFWLNEMGSGATHEIHSHFNVHFSGCIYVDLPDNSGNIVFSSFRERYDYVPMRMSEYTIYNSNTWGYTPKEGQLFRWESWIRHGVPATAFEGVRRSAAFDVFMSLK